MSTVNDFTFDSGRWGVSFSGVSTDTTLTLKTSDGKQVAYLEFVQLNCYSSGIVELCDDSSGANYYDILAMVSGEMNSRSQSWDFRDDPIKVLGTSGDHISIHYLGGVGVYSGFISGYWGF